MRYGIWTGFYLDLALEEALHHLAEQGWRDLEMCSEHMEAILADGDVAGRLRDARRVVEEEGITLWQGHLLLELDLAPFDETACAANLDTARRWLDGFAALGVANAVIHPGGFSADLRSEADWRRVRELNYRAFRALIGHAAGTPLCLCLENLFDNRRTDRRRFGARVGDLLDIIDQLGSDRVGICLDTGHANIQGLDLPTAVRECGSRLWATHIADNDGSGDQHLFPYGGRIPWTAVVDALYEIGYDGLWNLEVPGEEHAPLAVRDLKLRYARSLQEYLLARDGSLG